MYGELQYFKAVKVQYESISSTAVWLVFQNLTAFPQNYVDLPQMYWTSWPDTSSVLLIAGGAVAGIGLLDFGIGFIGLKVLHL
jgi:hypothetical protein